MKNWPSALGDRANTGGIEIYKFLLSNFGQFELPQEVWSRGCFLGDFRNMTDPFEFI